MPKTDLEFSHSVTTYVFKGEPLPQPAPGTYDASAWTPPTHRMYKVEFQNGGKWWLEAGLVVVDQGDFEKPSRKRALELIEEYRARQAKIRDSVS